MGHRTSLSGQVRAGVSASAVAFALVIASPALAQSDTATLQGHVDGAQAGAQVIATDTHTGQKATGTVDASGNYEILGLRPSTYKVEMAGRTAQQTTLFVGQTGVVDFYEPGKEIVVTGRVRREVRTQTVSTNITPAQIENLPQNTRNFLSFAAMAPGVNIRTDSGSAQIQSGATSSSNTNVLLDGMSMKNLTNHGGVVGQNFGLGNPFPEIAVQEYKIDTQNFGAEVGQTGSTLITAITKSGGDQFHGTAFIEFQPRQFIEQPYFDQKAGNPKGRYNRKQFGGDLGGPIIPGKLFFYVAGEGTTENLPANFGKLNAPVPSSLASQILTSRSKDFHQGLYFGKLTYLPSDADTVNFSAFIRRESNLNDIDDNATLSHGRQIYTHQDRYQGSWKHAAGDTLNVLNLSYDKVTQSTPSFTTGPEYVLSGAADFSTIALTGAHSFTQSDTQKAITLKDDLTLHHGAHTIKAGAQVQFLDLSRSVADHFNGSYFFVDPGAAGTFDPAVNIPYGFKINVQPTATVSAKDTTIGLYLQDEWKADSHWTLNYGLRWDFETNANNNNYVTPANIVTALSNYQGWKAAGINYLDYVSTGNNRKPEWGALQPRLGFSYDVHGDRDTVIFGGIGRYFDRNLFIEGVNETLTNSNQIVQQSFCGQPGAPANCIAFTSALRDPAALRAAITASGTGGSVWLLKNNTPLPFSDQIDIGIRKKFGSIQASLTLSHIRAHNIFQFVRGNRYENGWYTRNVTRTPIVTDAKGNYVSGGVVTGCTDGGNAWIQDGIPGSLTNADGSAVPTSICAAQNGQLPGFNGKLNIGASAGQADYTAVFLQLEKPFTDSSKWGFNSVLTIQSARTNDQQELNSDEFYNGSSQTVYGWGYANGVEKWRFVTTGNYRAPWGVQLSGTLTLTSGPAFGNIQAPWNSSVVAPDGACCYAKMGGVFYPKPFIGYKRLDLRVAKTFKMPFGAGHELTVDFQAFNVFNWLNRKYSSWGAGGGNPAPLVEDSQVDNDARSFQAGIKYKF